MEKALKKIILHLLKGSSINCLYRRDILNLIYVLKNGETIVACYMLPEKRMTFNVSLEFVGDVYEIMGWNNIYEDYDPSIVVNIIKDILLVYLSDILPPGVIILPDIYNYLSNPTENEKYKAKTFVIK